MKLLYITLGFITTLVLVGTSSALATRKAEKVTICHATGSSTNPYTRIVVSENAIGGHFENPGTPKAGHEDDLLFTGEVECPEGAEPTVTPTPTISEEPTPTVEPTVTPTATPSATISPTRQPERVTTGGAPDGLGCAVKDCRVVDPQGNPVVLLPPSQSGK